MASGGLDEKRIEPQNQDKIHRSTFPRAYNLRKTNRIIVPNTISNKRRLLGNQLSELSAQLMIITAESFRDSLRQSSLVFKDGIELSCGSSDVPELPELDATSPPNLAFIQHEEFLKHSIAFLQHQKENPIGRLISLRVSKLLKLAQEERERTMEVKKECWLKQKLISGMNKDTIVYTCTFHLSSFICLTINDVES